MELMTPKEAAGYLKVSVPTLAKWRLLKKGPSYIRVGRKTAYDRKALDSFLRMNIVNSQAAGV